MYVLVHSEPVNSVLTHFQDVLFIFSAQHDCRMASCRPAALQYEMQERQETTRTKQLILHEDEAHFIINLHALHNSHLLRKVLPIHLTTPKPLYADCKARHHEIAAALRVSQVEKRARTAEKRKATNAAKKKHAQQATTVDEDERGSDSDAGDEGNMPDVAGVQGRRKRRRGEK